MDGRRRRLRPLERRAACATSSRRSAASPAACVYLTGTGGEKLPDGVDPLTVMVERSVPLEAMNDAILAWEMNGEPLSLAHGGPLRLIVPGYQGVNNVKYVKRVAFTATESQARDPEDAATG